MHDTNSDQSLDNDPTPANLIQFPPAPGDQPIYNRPTGYDDDGNIIPVDPHQPGDTVPEDQGDPLDEARIETIKALLAFLGLGESNLKKIGWRTALFTYLVFQNESQAELAKRLKVSPGSVAQHLKSAREELGSFLRAGSRQ